jgi:hypothetical protein
MGRDIPTEWALELGRDTLMDDRDAPAGGESVSYYSAPNLRLSAADGVDYAYRDVGQREGRAFYIR